MRAEAARALAEKLDAARASDTVAAAQAAPALARQLLEIVAELRDTTTLPDALDQLRRRFEARRLAVAAGRVEPPE